MVFQIYDKQEQMEVEQYVYQQVLKEFKSKDVITNKAQDLAELQRYAQSITNKHVEDNYYSEIAPKVLLNLKDPHTIDIFFDWENLLNI